MKIKSILLAAVCMFLAACIPEVETANTAASENQIHTFGNSFKIDLKLAAGDADRNFVIKYLSARTLRSSAGHFPVWIRI